MKQSSATILENRNFGAKAVIFTRVSTKDQEDSHSLNAQLKRLKEYCNKHNFNLIKEFEVSESSTIGDRKLFKEMISFVEAESKKTKSTIALVVDSVDRLQRGFKECSLIDDLRKAKVLEVHFYKEGFFLNDNSSTSDIMRWDFGILGAKMYVAAISDNVKRGNLYALNNGIYPGKPPIGYEKIILPNGQKNMIHDKTRAHYVKKIFELYSTNTFSLKDLEKQCQEWNLISNKSKTFKPICKNTIDDILKDPFYCGEIYVARYNKFYPHKYEPIISKWLFDKCKNVTEARNKNNNKQSIQTSKKDFIFRGIVRCAITGKVVTCDDPENRHGKKYIYLMTWNPENLQKKVYVKEEDILSQIKEVFKSISVPQKLLDEITKYLQTSNETEKEIHKMEMGQLNKRLLEIDEEENRLITLYTKRRITDDNFDKNNKKLEEERAILNTEREMFTQADKTFKNTIITAFNLLTKAYELFENSKNDQKRQLINFVFSKLYLRGKKLEFTMAKPFDLLVNLNNRQDWRWTNPIGNIALSNGLFS